MPLDVAPPAAEAIAERFSRDLDRLGPFGSRPRLAVAASGGADSTALALLAADWARARGGQVVALIVDHGLRPGSAAEAALTGRRLAVRGLPARLLTLMGLHTGPGLAARARDARYAALIGACRAAGVVHLLLGHHAGDQAETYLLRARAGSGPAGLAAMAPVSERIDVRLLRPLLQIDPAALRTFLRARGMGWIEDPTNLDPRATRARLRAELAATGQGPMACAAAAAAGAARERAAARVAAILAERVRFSPLGYAVLSPGAIEAGALAAVIRTIGGRPYPPPGAALARLASAPGPATLAGVRMLAAGRLGPGWLLVREHPAPPVAARMGAAWNDFRLLIDPPADCTIAPVNDAPIVPRLPAIIRRVLPALWRGPDRLAGPESFGFRPPHAATW